MLGFLPYIVIVVLGYVRPKLSTAVVAAAAPIVWLALTDGLGATSDDGYENWALVVLPVLCVVCAGLAGVGMLARHRVSRSRI